MLNVQLLQKRTLAQIFIFVMILMNITLSFAQSTVSVLVTDKAGEPLIGVNVIDMGSNFSAVTILDGIFPLYLAHGNVWKLYDL